jgi:YVTN family beta-propeller protein
MQCIDTFAIVALILILTSGAPVRTAAADTTGSGKVSTPSLKLLKTLRLGGEGRWDYLCVDAAARRLYVPRSTHVQVVDLEKGSLLGDIPDTNGVHGVALCLEQNLGFASSGRDNAVTVFDLKTLKVTKTVKAGRNPDAILFDPLTKHIFAFNHSGGSVTVIDPSALDKEPVTIEVGGTLEFGVSDEAGHVFVNVENKSEIVEIDSKANRVLAHWSIAPVRADRLCDRSGPPPTLRGLRNRR